MISPVARRSAREYVTSMNGRNHLHHGDCIEGMSQLDAGAVDLVFADPPFNIGYDYDVYEDRKHADEYLAWTKSWGEQVQRVLKTDGTRGTAASVLAGTARGGLATILHFGLP